MRSSDASGSSNQADLLPALDGISGGNLRLAHMEVARHESIAVVDVDDVPREKEFGDERDDAAIRGVDRIAGRSAIVDTEMAARDLAVEDAAGSELARDPSGSRPEEGQGEELRRVLRVPTDPASERVFVLDARFSSRVEPSREFGIDAQPAGGSRATAGLRDRGRLVRIRERRVQRVDVLRGSRDDDGRGNRIRCVDRGRGYRCRSAP